MDLNLELDGDYFRETGFDLCGHILDLLTVNAAVLLIGENVTNLMLMPSVSSYIRHKDFLRSFVCPDFSSVTLRPPPLDSETGWTGELWSNRGFLILEN